ncbi:MAG: DUF4241 domain-containing protein [Oscillospiraceae bacterium]|nr:DUF4241 domain-containing protein [Oscillospiraceae bacterium]
MSDVIKKLVAVFSVTVTLLTGCSDSGTADSEETALSQVSENVTVHEEAISEETEENDIPKINVPMTKEDYDIYFPGNDKDNVSAADIAEITVTSGHLTALDCFYYAFEGNENIPYYTESVPNGSYKVTASISDNGIAAALVSFTDKEPSYFRMALYEGQDSSQLEEGSYYGFGVDAGLAVIGDPKAVTAYLDYQDKFHESDPSAEFYTDHLEEMIEAGYEKYPGINVDFIDYIVPGTEQHIAIMESGWGDGVYPVYFGYDENEQLCCAVAQYIYTVDL